MLWQCDSVMPVYSMQLTVTTTTGLSRYVIGYCYKIIHTASISSPLTLTLGITNIVLYYSHWKMLSRRIYFGEWIKWIASKRPGYFSLRVKKSKENNRHPFRSYRYFYCLFGRNIIVSMHSQGLVRIWLLNLQFSLRPDAAQQTNASRVHCFGAPGTPGPCVVYFFVPGPVVAQTRLGNIFS